VKPVLQALILADHVYVDAATGKRVICGTFSAWYFTPKIKEKTEPTDRSKSGETAEAANAESQPNVPSQPKPGATERKIQIPSTGYVGTPFVYLNMTDLHGEVPLVLEFIDLSSNKSLMRVEFTVRAPSPLDPAEVHLAIPPLPVAHEGAYALSLLWNDELLGSLRIIGKALKDEGGI